jgi:uncharacterized protein YjaG (DUF416 family)
MKRFQAMAQRITAFVLSAGMMASAAAPTVLAAQQAPSAPLGAENSVDELGNVDVSDDDGTLLYPEWDDEVTADFPDEDLDIEEPEEELLDEDVSDDPELEIAEYGISIPDFVTYRAVNKLVSTAESEFKSVDGQNVHKISNEKLASCTGAYLAADEALNAWNPGSSYKTKKNDLRKRLNKLKTRYNAYSTEIVQRGCITAADAALKEVESAIDKDEADPGALNESELATVVGLYKVAEEAIKKVNDDQPEKARLVKRLNAAKVKVDHLQKLLGQNLAYDAAKAAIDEIGKQVGGKNSEDFTDITAVIALQASCTGAQKLIDQMGASDSRKAELQNRLDGYSEIVNAAYNRLMRESAKELLKSVIEKIKKGDLSADELRALKENLQKVEKYLPDNLKQDYYNVMDAIDTMIKALELKDELQKTLDQLKDELSNGKVSQDTIDRIKALTTEIKDLADQISQNPIFKAALDEIVKKAEEAVKQAVAEKALEALKNAIASGDPEQIEKAYNEAKKAIEALRPYLPEVADKLAGALDGLKKDLIDSAIKDLNDILNGDGSYQDKIAALEKVTKKYEDLIKDIDASGALKELWEAAKNEQLVKLIGKAKEEIDRIVNDDSMSAIEKVAALDKLYNDLHTALEKAVGKAKADELLKPFDDLLEKAKDTIAQTAAAAADKLLREALLAVKKAVNSAESKEDAINQMETIYSQAYDLLTRSGMSAEDAASKLEPLRSAIDSLKKFLKDSFISLDTIQAAVSVIVDAALASDTTEKGLYDLVRTVLDGKDTDPAVKRVILVVARDVLDKADWTQLTPSLLNDVVDLAVDKVKDKYGKYPFVNELMDELKDPLNELVHREVGWDTINKVREVFFNAIDNAVAGIDAGKDNEALLAQARADLLKLSPVVSEEMQRIGAKAADLISDHLKDKITNALPGIQLPEFIGNFVGGLAQDVVNEKLDEYDPKLTATIDQYVLYLTCPGHDYHYITTRATTCTEDGEEKLKCSKCGWVRSDNKITHKKLGHVPVVDEAADPTETEEGLTEGSHCARCGAVLEAQEVIPALQPQMDAKLVCSAIPEETVTAMRYENRKKLDAAMDAALTKAGYTAADSQRFLAQVNSSIGILPSDRYPEEGFTGYVARPAQTAADKKYTWYAVQLLTVDAHGHNAGDVIITPVAQTDKGLQLTVYAQAVVALAWKEAK